MELPELIYESSNKNYTIHRIGLKGHIGKFQIFGLPVEEAKEIIRRCNEFPKTDMFAKNRMAAILYLTDHWTE